MSIFFDEILLSSYGMVSVCDIPVPTSGKKLKITTNHRSTNNNAVLSLDVFLSYEGKIVGPVKSGDTVETSVLPVVGKIFQTASDAKAIVVSKEQIPLLSPNEIKLSYSLTSTMGITVTAQIVMRYSCCVHISDSKEFVHTYANSSFAPEATASNFINNYLNNSARYIINALNASNNETEFGNTLPDIAVALAKQCEAAFTAAHPWGALNDLTVSIDIPNIDAVLSVLNQKAMTANSRDDILFQDQMKENEEVRARQTKQLETQLAIDIENAKAERELSKMILEAKTKLTELITQGDIDFKRELLIAIKESTIQTSDIQTLAPMMVAYLQSHPGATHSEMAETFNTLNAITKRNSPQEVLLAFQQLGLLEKKK